MRHILFILLAFSTFFSFSQLIIPFSSVSNNQTFNTCNGFIIDSGGQGGPGYGNNESTVITICSDTPGDIVSVIFNLFNLSLTDDNPAPNATNVDYVSVYDGTSTAANTLGTYSGTDLLGVVIMATSLNPTGCLTFKFTSNSVGTGSFTASASCNTPCADPVASGIIVGGITTDSIRVCPNEVVNFQNQGSFAQTGFNIASYSWDFMDNTTSALQNPSHSFSIPGLYQVQLFVTDDNPDNVCVNNNLISLQVLVATYPDFSTFPSDTTLCIGESVSFTAVPEDYEVLWDGFPNQAAIDDGCLTDDQLGVSQNVDLLQTGFVAGSTITNVNQIQSICFDLEHSFMGDIVIQLTCPNGQSVILHQQGGGGTQIGVPNQADGIDCTDPTTIGTPFTYCFTPTATQTWIGWVAAQTGWSLTIPAGDYAPVGSLNSLVGCPANGVWTLSVTDNWSSDDGCLFSFGLDLDPSFYPTIISFEPQIGPGVDSSYWAPSGNSITNISTNGDVVSITPSAGGTYNYIYTVVDNFGCTNDTSVNIVVNANPTVFAGNDTTICNGAQMQLNGQVSGVSSNCDFTLVLTDAFGDGWNGNTIVLNNNGVPTTYNLTTGLTQTFTIPVVSGTSITATLNAIGSFIGECSFEILDPNGVVVVTQGPNLTAGTVNTFTALCSSEYTYSWTPANLVDDATVLDPLLNIITPSTLTLAVFPTGHPACTVTDDIFVGFSVNPNAGVDNVLSICATGTAVDLYPLLGITPIIGVTEKWLNPAGQVVTMPYNPVTMNPGNYVFVVDNGGCTDSATVVVTEISTTITNSTVTDVNCNGANNGSITITGTNVLSYKMNNGASVPSGSPIVINSLAPGVYFIEVFGPSGCSDDVTLTIIEPLPISITSLTDILTVCPGSVVPLAVTATGGNGVYIFNWTENLVPMGVGANVSVTPLVSPSQYCVIVSEACGSTPATECMTVLLANPIVPSLVPDTTSGCFPVTINFTNTIVSPDFLSMVVNFGDGSTASYNNLQPFSHQYTGVGSYTVTVDVTSILGCHYITTYSNLIETYDYPIASFTVNPNQVSMFKPFVNLMNQSSDDVVSYLWDIPKGTPASSVLENLSVSYPIDSVGTYPITLYVTNIQGCIDSIVGSVIVFEEVLLYAPNTFTPDGDTYNQTWVVYGVGINPSNFNLKLFNRWGELVWETTDIHQGWDGKIGGEFVQDGAYNWMISAGNNYNDNKYSYRGFVNVIR